MGIVHRWRTYLEIFFLYQRNFKVKAIELKSHMESQATMGKSWATGTSALPGKRRKSYLCKKATKKTQVYQYIDKSCRKSIVSHSPFAIVDSATYNTVWLLQITATYYKYLIPNQYYAVGNHGIFYAMGISFVKLYFS